MDLNRDLRWFVMVKMKGMDEKERIEEGERDIFRRERKKGQDRTIRLR